METDQLQSATEDRMDSMMMMMMMDKFPDFHGAYNDISDLAPQADHFHGATHIPANANSIPHFLDGAPHINASPPFITLPSNSPFTNTNSTLLHQDQSPSSFLPNPRWRGGVEEFPPGASACSRKKNSMAAMREMIFRIAAMQPIHIDPESVKPPKRRNVKISKDPQSVAARHRRERISEKIRILQRLVPGGTKMDTASMLDEAIHYVKFLKTQVQSLERVQANRPSPSSSSPSPAGIGFPVTMASGSYISMGKPYNHEIN